jgi:hypothetical protein
MLMKLELRSYVCDPLTSMKHRSIDYVDTTMDSSEEKKEPNHMNTTSMSYVAEKINIITGTALSHSQQAPSSMSPSAPTESIDVFESEMRGVHAKTDILPNTVCMTIPLRCLITVEMGQATEIGRIIAASDLDLDAPKHIYLMIYILWDRKVNGRHSFFDPYYQILPQTLHNMPIFWTDEELAELTGSYIVQQIYDRNQAIIDDYNAICTIAPQMLSIATVQEFQWARMCVCSRNFGLCISGIRTSALVPHADMLNHYRPRETKWTYDESIQAFTITSLQHIRSGCEVLDSYGQKCNHRFLLNYGFAVEDNRELDGFCPNEVPIELSIFPNDPIFDEKIDFWIRGSTSTHHTNNNTAVQYATHPSATNNTDNNNTLTTASREHISTSTLKRIRICVTNNENTRLLFSLLRIISATTEEFRIFVVGQSQSTTSIGAMNNAASAGTTYPIQDRNTIFDVDAISSRQYRNDNAFTSQQHLSSSTINNIHRNGMVTITTPALTKSNPIATRYHRSCRDIRHPINLRNERESMKLLRSIIQHLLIKYPTTLQQDIDALHLNNIDEYPKFSNRRHAKIQVKGEKMVLHHYLKWAQTAIDVLNVIEGEIRDEIEHYSFTHISLDQSNGIEVRWQECDASRAIQVTMATEPKNMSVTQKSAVELNVHKNHASVRPQDDLVHRKTMGDSFGTASSFDMAISRMEMDLNASDQLDDCHDVHHTILRYCSDVLGHVRQEEFRHLRQQLLQLHLQHKGNHGRASANADFTGYYDEDKDERRLNTTTGTHYQRLGSSIHQRTAIRFVVIRYRHIRWR